MKIDKPFVFGKVTGNTGLVGKRSKPKKIKPVQRKMDKAIDAFNCKDRIKTRYSFCINDKCVCKYRNYSLDDIYLEVNKKIIQDFFAGRKKVDTYISSLLKLEWKSNKLNNRLGKMVYDFIKQCKIVYELDLLVKRKKREKVNTASEAVKCLDRIPNTNFFCKGCKIIEDGVSKSYQCYYSCITEDGVNREVVREWFVKKLKSKYVPEWDKIILTFNWASLSARQEVFMKHFIFKYFSYLLTLNQQQPVQKPNKKVIRKPVKKTTP